MLVIIFSSLKYVALLHSTLANVSAPHSWGWGTMAAAGRRRPPWLGCFCCSLTSKTCNYTDSYMEKGGQIKMSIMTFFMSRSFQPANSHPDISYPPSETQTKNTIAMKGKYTHVRYLSVSLSYNVVYNGQRREEEHVCGLSVILECCLNSPRFLFYFSP
jgi:hypothetical protein